MATLLRPWLTGSPSSSGMKGTDCVPIKLYLCALPSEFIFTQRMLFLFQPQILTVLRFTEKGCQLLVWRLKPWGVTEIGSCPMAGGRGAVQEREREQKELM